MKSYKDYIINNNNERIYLNYKVIIKALVPTPSSLT